MEEFCRGCLIRYENPLDLLQYTEKYRRLFLYSTGLQVKRNETVTFQLCKDCSLSMKASCKFKKLCRASDKKLKSYLALKDVGNDMDFCTYLSCNEETMGFCLPMDGNSTPMLHNKSKDDDNESTCTSIRNFMTDILQGEEVPDTEARIIREVIEEEADVLDDSLDSHWLQDDASSDSRLDFSFSQFATPHSIYNDHCYTPMRLADPKHEQPKKYFTSISPAIHKNCNVFTDIIRNTHTEKELCVFGDNFISIDTPVKNVYTPIIDDEIVSNQINLQNINHEKSNCNTNLPNIGNEISINSFDLPMNYNTTSINNVEFSINHDSVNDINLRAFEEDKSLNNIDISSLPSFDGEKSINHLDLSSLPSIDNERSTHNLDFLIADSIGKINTPNCYVPTDGTNYMTASNEIESIVNTRKKIKDEKPCTIDKNLERLLANENNTEISLDDLLDSPQVYHEASGASTPTITNILFGKRISENIAIRDSELIDNYELKHKEIFDELLKEEQSYNNNTTLDIKDKKVEIKDGFKDPTAVGIRKKPQLQDKKLLSKFDDSQLDLENRICKLCDKKFESIRALTSHFVKMHHKRRKYKLRHKLNIGIEMIKKIEIKDDIKNPIAGEEVDIGMEQKNVNQYLTERFDLENFICKICDVKYENVKSLKNHTAKIHRISIVNKEKKENTKNIVCCYCGTECNRRDVYYRHLKKHKKEMNENDTTQKVYKCDNCTVEFSNKTNLIRHIQSHNGNFAIRGSGKYICNICGATSTTLKNLNLHKRRHTKIYSHTCAVCGKGFYRMSDYTIHMRIHTGETPYSCTYCSRKFSRKDALTKHVRYHIGERPHHCEHCNSSFVAIHQLNIHQKTSKACMKKRAGYSVKDHSKQHPVEAKKYDDNFIATDEDSTTATEVTYYNVTSQLPYIDTEMCD